MTIARLVLWRLLQAVPVLLLVAALAFALEMVAGDPVTARAPAVRPWKPPWVDTIWSRPTALPCLRAILSAASLASSPLLQKNAPARPEMSHSLRTARR